MSPGATGVTRLTILAGTTSTGAGGAGAAADSLIGAGGTAEPAELLAGGVKAVVTTGRAAAGAGVRPTAESLASTVRPGNEFSPRRTLVTGAELMGASSGIDCCGESPMGAPYTRCGGGASRCGRDATLRSEGRVVDFAGARSAVRSVRGLAAERSPGEGAVA
jgi:hypothetical protein